MERSKEARRATTMSNANGFSRRRHRNSTLRDSPEEAGQLELQETVRLRERANKKERERERDREMVNRSKRRRVERYVQGSVREEGEESTEESFGDEEEDDGEDGGTHRNSLAPNSSSASPAAANQNHRRSSMASRIGRPLPAWKVTEEMIGVPVPRKARTASVKRSHDYSVSGGVGIGEELNHRQLSASPASRSGEVASPSSSNASVRKKMKPNGAKNRTPKVSKSPTADQEDIEFEIAEVLYGLGRMKQSQSSKKPETVANSPQNLDSNGISHDTQNNVPPSSSLLGVCSKRNNMEAEDNSIPVQTGSMSSTVKIETEQTAKVEKSSPELEKIYGFKAESREAAFDLGSSRATVESLEEAAIGIKSEESKPLIEESGSRDGFVRKEKPLSPKEESPLCPKLDVDAADSLATKAISNASEVETQREEKFKIDLMAPPPMEKDGLIDLASDTKIMTHDAEIKTETVVNDGEKRAENVVMRQVLVEGFGEKKLETNGEKRESPKLDLEKQDQENDCVSTNKLQQQPGLKQQPKATYTPKGEKNAQSGSLPFPITVAGWPGSLPSLGYMPPLQTIVSLDGSATSSTPVQPPHFFPSQPRPKRCATHHYIARNIYYQQQFAKMNQFWPPAAGPPSLYGAKPYNVNSVPNVEKMVLGGPLHGSFPGGNSSSVQEKRFGAATFPGHTGKEKNSEAASVMDTAQKKQLVLQQGPQPIPAGNLMHGPAFIFPLSQHQAGVAASTNQSGPLQSALTANNGFLSGNSAAGAPASSSALPAVAAAVSFNYPNLPANEAPYMAILQNNGYPFPISTHVGTTPPFRGTHAQAMPYFNGPFYSSQMLNPSQIQQQQPHSQPVVQSSHQNTSTSSGSSLSHKQTAAQLPRRSQLSPNNFLTSTNMQLQQQQKQHVLPSHSSRKSEAEMSDNTPSVPNSHASNAQKSGYGQNFAVPVQQLNFTLMPPAALSGSAGGNHGEKQQQQSQQQGLKGGVELIPSQAIAMSFAAFNGSGATSGLNFSSMAQTPAIFQSLPDMARHGYHLAPAAAQAGQQKTYQISEQKTGGDSTTADDGRKNLLGKAPSSVGQSLAFSKPGSTDPSASTIMGTTFFGTSPKTLNFVSSPASGNRPSRSMTSTVMTTSAPVAVNSQNSPQHQQLLHLQKQQQQLLQLQKQQQLQHAVAARNKPPVSNPQAPASIAAKFPNNPCVFSETIQSNTSAQPAQWKNTARHPVPLVPSSSLAVSATSTIKNLPQQQGRATQSHTQISFGVNHKSATASQGQSTLVGVSPSNSSISKNASGSLKTASTGNKAGPSVPTLQSQRTENSSTGPGQKSSPVCGRNVPSILSTCLQSELKY